MPKICDTDIVPSSW